jgi:hypothetical protein
MIQEIEFAPDSPLEGNGFELPVPRAMQARLKAIIAAFCFMPPPLDYLRLPSMDVTAPLSRAEPEVRIHFPPAARHTNSIIVTGLCESLEKPPHDR